MLSADGLSLIAEAGAKKNRAKHSSFINGRKKHAVHAAMALIERLQDG